MQKKHIYTRNLAPLDAGTKLPNILIYDHTDEEIDLHTIKKMKVYISVPSFENQSIMNEIQKLDTIFIDFPEFNFYLISNESSFIQNRLAHSKKFQSFQILSDFKHRNFARYTGTYIYEISALVKSIFIVDEDDTIQHVTYFDDLYSNFDAVEITKKLNALK